MATEHPAINPPSPLQQRSEDAAARAQALDASRSFIVQAPAGSGKTELLIQRLLVLLAQVDEPEEIVAMTFTRKAAGEMRRRVLQALQQARAEPCPGDAPHKALTWNLARAVLQRDAARGWQIESNVSRLRLQTIDSLCASLTRQMPVLSRFGAQPEPIEDASQLYREAARATLAVLESSDPAQAALVDDAATLLAHLDCDSGRVIELLVDLLARRDQWLPALGQADDRAALQAVFALAQREGLAQVDQALRAVDPGLPERLMSLARFAAGNLQLVPSEQGNGAPPLLAWLDALQWPEHTPTDLPRWLGLAQLLLTEKDQWRSSNGINKRIGFPAASAASDPALAALFQERKAALGNILEQLRNGGEPAQTLLSDLAAVRALPPAQYSDTQWRVLGAITRLARLAAARLRLVFAQHGQADFTEVAQQAIVALGDADDPSDLALRLDYRIRHLLVDEFQDTSYTQFALLQRLTAGWEADEEGALGRSLFLVGDPMQSIYRFRQAEVGLFLRARAHGLGDLRLHALRLSVNFRSSPGIVDWVNNSFKQLMPQHEDIRAGAVSYAPSVSAQETEAQAAAVQGTAPQTGDDRLSPAVHIDLLRLPADDNAAPGAREAQCLLQHVRAALARDAQGSIAILVRARTHVRAIAQALRDAAIAYRAIEIETLNHQPVVQDLYALTRALAHPADRLSWLAVLRAPWCGLTLADLHALAGNDQRSTVTELLRQPERLARLSADGQMRVARLLEALQPLLAVAARGSLRQQVEAAWLALAGPACTEGAADLADAAVYLDFLEAAEQRGEAQDLDALGEQLGKLYAQPEAALQTVAQPATPVQVQIMTIHKAKGLEFDTVIVPGLARTGANDRVPLLQWLHRPADEADQDSELLLAPIDGAGSAADPHLGKTARYVQAQEKRCQQHEEVRLLYVAATRARSRLHWLAEMKPDRNKEYQPARASLLATLWPVCQAASPQPAAAAAAASTAERDQTAQALAQQEQQEVLRNGAARSGNGAARSAIDQRLRRLPSDWQMPPLPGALQWQVSAVQDEQAAAEGGKEHAIAGAGNAEAGAALAPLPIEFSWAGETARHVGIVAHAWLQRMAQDALQGWDAARLAGLQASFQRELLACGVARAECVDAAQRVRQVLQAALEDARGRWVLGAKPWARNEWRIRYRPAAATPATLATPATPATPVLPLAAATFIMDRVFLDDDGVLWIVDYKTSTHDGADLEGFLDREQQRYREQLERYARILRQLRLPLPASLSAPLPGGAGAAGADTSQRELRLGLYFPQLRGWRSWTPEGF